MSVRRSDTGPQPDRDRAVDVWLDADLGPPARVGELAHDRGQVRFRYDPNWRRGDAAFAIDPDLALDDAPAFPRPTTGQFGIFLDSSPDRWGQTLMKRREALQAKDEGRAPRTLRAWDFLLGVQDATRQGALRFRRDADRAFLADEALAAPPVTSLRELEAVALQLSARRIDDLDALRRWLAVLVAPGASLGGARPKANFTDPDGSLWIAKFPARDDDRDVAAWEFVVHRLAADAGLDVPPGRLVELGSAHRTFCTRRFDRVASTDGRVVSRRFYASAMTLLRKDSSEGTSYLELAECLNGNGSDETTRDLHQLFRRVVFNVAVGNRDDHLRNHGFLLGPTGWRPAPAFDLNPSADHADHVLNLDEFDNRPSLPTVLTTAAWYRLGFDDAMRIVDEVTGAVDGWRERAREAGLSRAEIEATADAFAAHERYRAGHDRIAPPGPGGRRVRSPRP